MWSLAFLFPFQVFNLLSALPYKWQTRKEQRLSSNSYGWCEIDLYALMGQIKQKRVTHPVYIRLD